MNIFAGLVARGRGIVSSQEQHFTVIRSTLSVQALLHVPATDYDPDQSLDIRQFFLSRPAMLSRHKLRENSLVQQALK